MTMPVDAEGFMREIEFAQISMLEDLISLLMKMTVDPGLSKGSRAAVALSAALFRVSVLDLRGDDTTHASEVVRLEIEAYLKTMAS